MLATLRFFLGGDRIAKGWLTLDGESPLLSNGGLFAVRGVVPAVVITVPGLLGDADDFGGDGELRPPRDVGETDDDAIFVCLTLES